jgi:hypothetical protein
VTEGLLSRSTFIRVAGSAPLLGGLLNLLTSLPRRTGLPRAPAPGSIVCLMIAVLGLHALLWGREGRLGRLGFALVAAGLFLGLIGMVGSALGLLDPNPMARITNTGEHVGLVLIGVGMLLWSIVTLRVKALGRWSTLPLALGLLGLAGISFLRPATFATLEAGVVPKVFAVCWILLGYWHLRSRAPAFPGGR